MALACGSETPGDGGSGSPISITPTPAPQIPPFCAHLEAGGTGGSLLSSLTRGTLREGRW